MSVALNEYTDWMTEEATGLQIRLHPAPVLREVAAPVGEDEFGPAVEAFGQKMIETMQKYRGVGLAANQVGLLKRIIIVSFGGNTIHDPLFGSMPRPEPGEPTILCNPVITVADGTPEDAAEEGCLSLPGVYQQVFRPREVHIAYRTPFGEPKDAVLCWLEARIAQHEVDHLDGINFFDKERMPRSLRRQVEREWVKQRPIAIRKGLGI
jgi:peptide deformylase